MNRYYRSQMQMLAKKRPPALRRRRRKSVNFPGLLKLRAAEGAKRNLKPPLTKPLDIEDTQLLLLTYLKLYSSNLYFTTVILMQGYFFV